MKTTTQARPTLTLSANVLIVEARSLARAIVEPDAVAWRLRFRRQRRRCPVLRSVFVGGRRDGCRAPRFYDGRTSGIIAPAILTSLGR